MHHLQDKVPIHHCPVDIFQFDRWTQCAIGPADVSTDKVLDVFCSRQFFHQRYFTPDANNPLSGVSIPGKVCI